MSSDRESKKELDEIDVSRPPTLIAELWDFLRHNKKWWLLPILIVLLLFGVLIFLSGTGAAPFIYTFH